MTSAKTFYPQVKDEIKSEIKLKDEVNFTGSPMDSVQAQELVEQVDDLEASDFLRVKLVINHVTNTSSPCSSD